MAFRKEVFTRLDSLMYGILGAYFSFYYQDKWKENKKLFMWMGILLLVIIRYIIPSVFHSRRLYDSVFSFSLLSLSILFFLPFFSNYKNGKGVFYKTITYLSLISYSMYLTNYSLVQGWIINKISWSSFFDPNFSITVQYISYWVLTILFSLLLFKYFELPFTNLRDRNKLKLSKSEKPEKTGEFQEVAI
jgi:peptidoglycan/LPS O-acetylase OafA/YrhL